MPVCRTCGKLLDESQFYKGELRWKRPRCIECSKEYARQYRKDFPEKVKASSQKTREKNREKLRQRNREFYAKTKNDPAHIEARKRTFEKNKEKWHKADKERRKVFNEKWKKPCEKCGESRLYLIQFHHIDPSTKRFCIGSNVASKKEEELENEVKKCVCLCSNCHDEFHYFYGSQPKNPVEAIKEYLGDDLNFKL